MVKQVAEAAVCVVVCPFCDSDALHAECDVAAASSVYLVCIHPKAAI